MANVRAWAHATASAARPEVVPPHANLPPEARAKLATLQPSDDKPGRVRHPFKVGDPHPYAKRLGDRALQRRIAFSPVARVPLDQLVSNGQQTVAAERVAHFLAEPSAPGTVHGRNPQHGTERPIVFVVDGKRVVYDGHTRATAAWLRGEKELEVTLVDLDDDNRPN